MNEKRRDGANPSRLFVVMKKPGVPPVVLQISTGRLQDMFRLICESLPGAIATPH